jgi:hypothetical protein
MRARLARPSNSGRSGPAPNWGDSRVQPRTGAIRGRRYSYTAVKSVLCALCANGPPRPRAKRRSRSPARPARENRARARPGAPAVGSPPIGGPGLRLMPSRRTRIPRSARRGSGWSSIVRAWQEGRSRPRRLHRLSVDRRERPSVPSPAGARLTGVHGQAISLVLQADAACGSPSAPARRLAEVPAGDGLSGADLPAGRGAPRRVGSRRRLEAAGPGFAFLLVACKPLRAHHPASEPWPAARGQRPSGA